VTPPASKDTTSPLQYLIESQLPVSYVPLVGVPDTISPAIILEKAAQVRARLDSTGARTFDLVPAASKVLNPQPVPPAYQILEEEVPRILEETFRSGDLGSLPFEVVEEPSTDKWTGGPRESALLAAVYFADTVSCLDWLTAEETFALSRSRPEMSLLLVERMLDRLGLDPRSREAFYRRGYQWAIDSGRWGPAVLESLEEKYRAQRASLLAMLDPERPPDPEALWGGREESRLAVSWIDRLGPPLAALAAAPPAGRIPVEVADFVAHAHSNRLGIHATQEAVIRHLVERARTELGAGAR
jgi:hypothetical protein